MTEFSIYQINVDRDTANVCFIGMESLEKIKGTKEVNAVAYDRVYDGKMDCISLENIYQKFNVDHPADYKGRSLSVSDVVEIRESDTLNPGFYFVDSIGFKSISFDKSPCKEPSAATLRNICLLRMRSPSSVTRKEKLQGWHLIVPFMRRTPVRCWTSFAGSFSLPMLPLKQRGSNPSRLTLRRNTVRNSNTPNAL